MRGAGEWYHTTRDLDGNRRRGQGTGATGPANLTRTQGSPTKPIIGLAGGIGAGKSSVARVFETLGAAVIDFDRLTHEQLRHPKVVTKLRRWWGDDICTAAGGVDHQAVASIVFDDPTQLSRLEGLLYPRLARRRAELLAVYERDPAVVAVVLDAAKLYEAGLDKLCNAVVFVEAERALRLQRLAETRGWTDAELTRRENLQNALDKKRHLADYVVVNHSGIDHLRPQVERVFSSVLASFS